jgi:short-subunit dehydrogenase
MSKYGCPDILINNAGFATYRTFENTDMEEIERLISVNLLGAMRCTKAFLPEMIARRRGVIVNMASIAGRIVLTPNGTYCAAKHGLVAWSETLRYELAHFSIQVNVICPGRAETSFFDHETFKTRAQRPETRFTISVEDISRATRRAIAHNRFITYIPWSFGLLVWLINALPFFGKRIVGRLLLSRIKSIYDQPQNL